MNKVINKSVIDGIDKYLQSGIGSSDTSNSELTSDNSSKKTIKKQDGLIERVDISKKVFITEDNRQLLND